MKTIVASLMLVLAIGSSSAYGMETTPSKQELPRAEPSLFVRTLQGAASGGACCKICTKGKACGNTCIAAHKICHVGPGCACDGRGLSGSRNQ